MKRNVRPPGPAPGPATEASETPQTRSALSRITLALLDEYSTAAEKQGYDPYNTTAAGRAFEARRRNPRRT